MLENRKTAIKNKVLLMEGFFFFFLDFMALFMYELVKAIQQ